MSYKFTAEEIETHFGQSKAERSEGVWHFFSNDPYWINRLKRQGCVIIREEPGDFGGLEGTIEHRQLSLRSRGKKTRPKGLRKSAVSEHKSAQL